MVTTPHAGARELEWVGSEYMLRWLARTPDVTITAFGAARATCSPTQPDVDFLNTVHRLLPDDADQVPVIAEHYAAAGVQPWLEVMPAPGFDRLAEALAGAGGRQIGWLTMSERELPGPRLDSPPPGVTIQRIDRESRDLGEFARVLPLGHGVPDDRVERAIERTRACAEIEGARLYLARVEGVPAAAAVLFLTPSIAYLANASTLEPYRRRGCQGALIRHRLGDAAAAGCVRACVITEWDTQSHANVVGAGFQTAYTKAVWKLAC